MKHWLLSLLLFATSGATLAATTEGQAPITIEADRMELDQKAGTNHYKGNVVLVRGTLQIKADSIILYTRKNKLHRAVAQGKPAKLEQAASDEKGALRAESDYMEYLPGSDSIVLEGNALLSREGNEFTGDKIRYDLAKQTVRASGDKQGDGRVRVILQPENETEQTEEQQ